MKTRIILTLTLIIFALVSFTFINVKPANDHGQPAQVKSSSSVSIEPAGGFGSEDKL